MANESDPAVHHSACVRSALPVWSVNAQSALPPITHTMSASQKLWSVATSGARAEAANNEAMSWRVRTNAHHNAQTIDWKAKYALHNVGFDSGERMRRKESPGCVDEVQWRKKKMPASEEHDSSRCTHGEELLSRAGVDARFFSSLFLKNRA